MSNMVPRSRRSRRRLIVFGLAVYLLVPVSLNAFKRNKPRPTPTPAVSPSPTPEPSPPILDFQAVPDRDNIRPDDQVNISLFIANKSSKTLTKLKLNFADPAFAITKAPALPPSLPAFRSVTDSLTIKPAGSATFGARKLVLTIEYAWTANNSEFVSTQPATVTVAVARRFEEETKGFPGGTAAFFYLLLPIIPAILSYQFFDGLRRGEGAKLPSFKPEYIVPAFLAAVLLSLVMLLAFRYDTSLSYSNPLVFIIVLFSSLIVGSAPPLVRWKIEADERREWGFTNDETFPSYLRKALLAPWSPREFEWAEGKVDEEKWHGVRLRQPDGTPVLGPVVQVFYPGGASNDQWNELVQQVVSRDGNLINKQRLVEMVAVGTLGVRYARMVTHDGVDQQRVVIVDQVRTWKRADGDASPLVRPFR
jgi:hypothetical protein